MDSQVEEFVKKFVIAAVSDDYPSSRRVLELAEGHRNKVIPCVGIHPWAVGKVSTEELVQVIKLIERGDVRCIGEVGLDKRFTPETFERQLEFFKKFVELAREYDLVLNLHAADAWRDVLDVIRKYDINKALFHWFTGPVEMLRELRDLGYYISINPAIRIQERHRRVAKEAPLEILLVESDGPYEYRGLRLEPPMTLEAVRVIAELKGVCEDYVWDRVRENFMRLFGLKF